jgi:hypothetical protein
MTTVDFLPFANDANANVDDQATWLAASSGTGYVKLGYPHGMLPSPRLNKAMRQPSVMVAALAQFMAAQTGQDILDSGGASSVTTLQGQILAAVRASAFPSGTKMLFAQTAAPTGWTKDITHNDKALRVVSGTASSGGSTAFSTVFASRTPAGTVGGHTLTTSEIPSHTHTGTSATDGAHTHGTSFGGNSPYFGGGSGYGGMASSGIAAVTNSSGSHTHTFTTDASGSGGSHTHSWTGSAMDFAVSYVDVIVATKD